MIELHVFKDFSEARISKFGHAIKHWTNAKDVKKAGGEIRDVIIGLAITGIGKRRKEHYATFANVKEITQDKLDEMLLDVYHELKQKIHAK